MKSTTRSKKRAALSCTHEPSYEEIKRFWPPVNNPLTFLSWPDHLFKFTLLWNGSLMTVVGDWSRYCQEHLAPAARHAVHLSVGFGPTPHFRSWPQWDGSAQPSAPEGEFPVYVLDHEIPYGGTIRQEVFSFCPDGRLKRGDEPMAAWVRFTTVRTPGRKSGLWLQAARGAICLHMTGPVNVRLPSRAEPYPHRLRFRDRLLLSDGRVRLGIVRGGKDARFVARRKHDTPRETTRLGLDTSLLSVALPAEGETLDLCMPFLPLSVRAFRRLARPGFEAARRGMRRFYRARHRGKTEIAVPNPDIERLYRAWDVHIATNIMRDPCRQGRERLCLTSPIHYEAIWGAQNLLGVHALDRRGYHREAADVMAPFLRAQGKVNAPSPFCIFPKGLFQDPPEHAPGGGQWLGDHGGVMWASAEHYLLTRDRTFYRRWRKPWDLACQWISNNRVPSRKTHDHRPVEYQRPGCHMPGLMHPGQATDETVQRHFVFSDGWLYKGLVSVIRAFRAGGDQALADTWQREADDYYKAFRLHYDHALAHAAEWSDGAREWPIVPTALPVAVNTPEMVRHVFYLDTGPMFLHFAELVKAGEPSMTAVLRYFTRGPNVRRWRDKSVDRVPVLVHEMSSAEPVYSWNMFLRLARGERTQYVEGLYSQFTGGIVPETGVAFEVRHGIFGLVGLHTWHLEQALVWMPRQDEMVLLAGCPRAWLRPGKALTVRRLRTYAGPFDLDVEARAKDIVLRWRFSEKRELRRLCVSLPGRERPVELPYSKTSGTMTIARG